MPQTLAWDTKLMYSYSRDLKYSQKGYKMMSEKVVLTLVVTEGDSGCRAEIKEFGIGLGVSTRDIAVAGIRQMVMDHCHTLIVRDNTSQATPVQLELAKNVVANGFEFQERIPKRTTVRGLVS